MIILRLCAIAAITAVCALVLKSHKSELAPLCIAAGYVLNNIALNLTTATSATFLRSMAIILTPILAFLIHRTRYRWVR